MSEAEQRSSQLHFAPNYIENGSLAAENEAFEVAGWVQKVHITLQNGSSVLAAGPQKHSSEPSLKSEIQNRQKTRNSDLAPPRRTRRKRKRSVSEIETEIESLKDDRVIYVVVKKKCWPADTATSTETVLKVVLKPFLKPEIRT